jgi:hypothetical protein
MTKARELRVDDVFKSLRPRRGQLCRRRQTDQNQNAASRPADGARVHRRRLRDRVPLSARPSVFRRWDRRDDGDDDDDDHEVDPDPTDGDPLVLVDAD